MERRVYYEKGKKECALSCCTQWSHPDDKMIIKNEEEKIPDMSDQETRQIFALMALFEEKYPTYKKY